MNFPTPLCCSSSERCESQRAAPDRNANSGGLHFVLRVTKHFVLLSVLSDFVEWVFLSPHTWLSKEGSGQSGDAEQGDALNI